MLPYKRLKASIISNAESVASEWDPIKISQGRTIYKWNNERGNEEIFSIWRERKILFNLYSSQVNWVSANHKHAFINSWIVDNCDKVLSHLVVISNLSFSSDVVSNKERQEWGRNNLRAHLSLTLGDETTQGELSLIIIGSLAMYSTVGCLKKKDGKEEKRVKRARIYLLSMHQ